MQLKTDAFTTLILYYCTTSINLKVLMYMPGTENKFYSSKTIPLFRKLAMEVTKMKEPTKRMHFVQSTWIYKLQQSILPKHICPQVCLLSLHPTLGDCVTLQSHEVLHKERLLAKYVSQKLRLVHKCRAERFLEATACSLERLTFFCPSVAMHCYVPPGERSNLCGPHWGYAYCAAIACRKRSMATCPTHYWIYQLYWLGGRLKAPQLPSAARRWLIAYLLHGSRSCTDLPHTVCTALHEFSALIRQANMHRFPASQTRISVSGPLTHHHFTY